MRLHLINRATGTTRIFATSMAFFAIEPVNAYDTEGAPRALVLQHTASVCLYTRRMLLTGNMETCVCPQ